MSVPRVEVNGLTKRFGRTLALSDVNVVVRRGEIACLLGPSGCGKTTLLRVIAGLEQPDAGRVLVDGRDVTRLPPGKRNFGIVFQNYALFPNMTVKKNVAYGLRGKSSGVRVEDMLATVGLEGLANRYPAQLSGGQQQRVALARALVLSPDLLLLDEPLSALDAKVRSRLRGEIRDLQRSLGVTTILVTHDQEEALTMADTVIVMNNAKVEQVADPRSVYERPGTPFVADFVGTVNFFLPSDLGITSEGPQELVAIRPEHIGLSPRWHAGNDAHNLRGRVKEVEFCGSSYRLTVETHPRGSSRSYNVVLTATADSISSADVRHGGEVSLDLPQERLLHFAGGADLNFYPRSLAAV